MKKWFLSKDTPVTFSYMTLLYPGLQVNKGLFPNFLSTGALKRAITFQLPD
jgi:hypothetical protein